MIGDDLPHSLPPGFTQVPADAESTSAALRRVEAERDAALADRARQYELRIAESQLRAQLGGEVSDLKGERATWQDHSARLHAEVQRLEALVIERTKERDQARAQAANALQCFDDLQTSAGRKYGTLQEGRDFDRADLVRMREQRDLAHAELASARQELALTGRELDQAAQGREDLTAQLATARQELDRLRRVRLPADDREVMEWFAFHGLDPAAPPVTVFAYLREDFNQPTEGA